MPISRAIRDSRGQYKRAYLYTESDDFDLTYFIRYNLDVIVDTLAEVRKYVEKSQLEQYRTITLIEGSDGLNLRQVGILKHLMQSPDRVIGIKEVMGTYAVAYGTARADLYGLENLGYLRKRKMGKTLQFNLDRKRMAERSSSLVV